ncbi:MAG: DUF2281 domain-containing protein [Gemmatimonadetes bacterium]|nr:DUF2281 domain-containing protein [Gemmatimonadota bacterium]
MRQRLMRRIETLPEEQVYQVLDYIEFLESKYGAGDLEEQATGLQRFAERLEDGLRRRTVSPSTLREAFQLISAADRVLSGVSSAGRQLLEELNGSDGSRRGHSGGGGSPGEEDPEPGGGEGDRGRG